MNSVLLHTCCAPCSLSCIEPLRNEGIEPLAFWYNPNIHPYTEYQARKATLEAYAKEIGMKLVIGGTYDLRPFVTAVAGNIDARCGYCYLVRMEETAKYAEEISGTKMPYWSPLSDAPREDPSKSPLLPFEAFGFAIKGIYAGGDEPSYDDKDGGYYVPIIPRAMADGGSDIAYVYSLQSHAWQYFKKSSLVILRSPLVLPEYEEIEV